MQHNTSMNASVAASRRRAPSACLACRARKIRCDAVHRDGQCTNCALDSQQCIVKSRPSKYRSSKKSTAERGGSNVSDRQAYQSSPEQAALRQFTHGLFNDGTLSSEGASESRSQGRKTSNCEGPWDQLAENLPNHMHNKTHVPMRYCTPPNLHVDSNPVGDEISNVISAFNPSPVTSDDCSGHSFHGHVIYSYFSFLKVDLSLMSQHDVCFLDTQGCFKVPNRQALDEFVHEYFLHVHPSLPLIDESAFWKMYSGNGSFSLLLFQAMLFASSGFLSFTTLQRLGFTSTRNARATYYRRAKLLFDFCGEKDQIANAQGALLLSYNASMKDGRRFNTLWLANAIQLAEGAGARQMDPIRKQPPKERKALKRLWWCCVVRDRILPLGVRRQAHISIGPFEWAHMLTENDFENEIEGSLVYDTQTKRTLIRIFITLCELAVSLTDMIMIIYPSSEPMDISLLKGPSLERTLDRLTSCKLGLQSWFDKATIQFPTPAGIGSSNESLVLYTNLMYMYYHSARLALHQFEALILATRSSWIEHEENDLHQSRTQLQDATNGITENLKELIQLKLTKYLPISVVAYSALPLVLHILDVKLATSPTQMAQRQGRLNVYMEAMNELQLQYDGTDEVRNFIRAVVEYFTVRVLQPKSTGPSTGDRSTSHHADSYGGALRAPMSATVARDWGHMLINQPTLFFRLSYTIDISLSKGRYPDDSDFPLILKAPGMPIYRFSTRDLGDGYFTSQDTHVADYSGQGDISQSPHVDQHEPENDKRPLSLPISTGAFADRMDHGRLNDELGTIAGFNSFDFAFGQGGAPEHDGP